MKVLPPLGEHLTPPQPHLGFAAAIRPRWPLFPRGRDQRETSYGCNSSARPRRDGRDAYVHSKPAVAISAAANHLTDPEEKAKQSYRITHTLREYGDP